MAKKGRNIAPGRGRGAKGLLVLPVRARPAGPMGGPPAMGRGQMGPGMMPHPMTPRETHMQGYLTGLRHGRMQGMMAASKRRGR